MFLNRGSSAGIQFLPGLGNALHHMMYACALLTRSSTICWKKTHFSNSYCRNFDHFLFFVSNEQSTITCNKILIFFLSFLSSTTFYFLLLTFCFRQSHLISSFYSTGFLASSPYGAGDPHYSGTLWSPACSTTHSSCADRSRSWIYSGSFCYG